VQFQVFTTSTFWLVTGDDTLNGKPVRARFIWSKITRTTCHWEQAYSPDEGKAWETKWVQDIERAQ